MEPTDLKSRTMDFAVQVSKFITGLPDGPIVRVVSGQLLRSSSSAGANYFAARRAKSKRDFINKLKIVEEESDESLYWLKYLEKNGIGDEFALMSLIREANELVSIIVTCIITAKANLEKEKNA